MAGGIDEAKGVQAVVGRVVETGGHRRRMDGGNGPDGLGMPVEERLHLRRIRLAGGGIGLGGRQLLVEGRRGAHGEDGDIVDAGAPFLAVGQREAQRHAADVLGRVGDEGPSTRQRKAPDHRNAAGREDLGPGEAGTLAVAVEDADEA